MALSKIIAEGVDLTDTFAFTGTVTGAGLTSPFANTVAVTSEGGAATTNLVQGLAKAWVNFNGTGTVAIRDSFSTSSITDGGTGVYTFNYATAMTDANHSGGGLCNYDNNGWGDIVLYANNASASPFTTTSMLFRTLEYASVFDAAHITPQILGDLA